MHVVGTQSREVQEWRTRYDTVLDDQNETVLFRHEETPTAVPCIGDVHGFIETGDGRETSMVAD